MLLALDSSTETMALALVGEGKAWHLDAEGGAKASQQMVPELMALLARAGLCLAEVQAIAFGRGPGAFTGLRTACAVAQGLALGADKPVLALDSLMLVAEDARQQAADRGNPLAAQDRLWVAMDARMDEIYAGLYRWDGQGWQTDHAPALYEPEALRAQLGARPAAGLAGSALQPFGLAAGAAATYPRCTSRARALGRLACQAWAQGQAIAADQALPHYVRDKVALTTAEREAAAAARAAGGPL